ncbi:MAG TPA: hypothetical protein VK014_06320 [Cyclobacteriaceae bacterium]|nr:hypothetical protein [Cyclobacteriaceae bacterium]
MKNKLLVPLLLGAVLNGLCFTLASAQEQDSVKHLRWELGVDLLPLFEKSDFPDYSLFGRYLLNPGKDKNTFLRIRVGYGLESYLDTANHGTSKDHTWNKQSYSFAVGVQRDISVSHRTRVYVGGDMSFVRSKDNKEWDNADGVIGYEVVRSNSTTMDGFAGISYEAGGMLSLSLESSLYLGLYGAKQKADVYRYNPSGELFHRKVADDKSQRLISGVRPFHQLMITYKF